MPVVSGREIAEFEVDGIRTCGLATPSRGAVEIMLWRNRAAPGSVCPAARRDHEEVVAVLAGAGTLREGGLELPFEVGDVLIIPAHVVCQIVPAGGGEPLDCVLAMPSATRHFTTLGTVMRLPWAR